jgi:uncharacterized membrane protein
VIVGIALHRLEMYEHAYGLTMLRLYATVFACWIGIVFLLLSYSMFVGRGRGYWFLSTSLAIGVVGLLVLNVINPERLVVQRNIARLTESAIPFDTTYINQLSPDAFPALRDALDALDPDARKAVVARICEDDTVYRSGWTAWNHSRSSAHDVQSLLCVTR